MSNLKCLICENNATFSIRTNSIFNYSEDAFYIDAIYCLAHYREELKRIYDGVGVSMTPDYKALSVRKEIAMESSNGTVTMLDAGTFKREHVGQVMPEPIEVDKLMMDELTKVEKMQEVMDSIIVKPVPVEEPVQEEEVRITKMSPTAMRQKTFEDEVVHAFNILNITKSYEIAKYLHRPRGSVYNAMRRLGLRPADKAKRKSYSSLPEND